MSITSRIKDLASERKMTIAELERKLEFGSGTISRWDVRNPGIDKIAKVADYFNVSTDYLSGRESYEDMKQHLNSTTSQDTPFVMNYRVDVANLTPEERESVEGDLQQYFEFLMSKKKKKN